jgi:hypothetical protein
LNCLLVCFLMISFSGHNSRRPSETNEQIAKFLAFRLTGNLLDYRALLVNSIGEEDEEEEEEKEKKRQQLNVSNDDATLLPAGWSKQ